VTRRGFLPVLVAATLLLAAAAEPAAAIPNGRYAIGDSVMLGAKPNLQRRGIVVNAVTSRQFSEAVRIVKRKAASGTLKRKVIIHLGTNGILIQAAQCDTIAKRAGARRRVYLMTVTGPTKYPKIRKAQNRRLRACAGRHANTYLLDWYGYSRGHGRWFYSDGMHLTPAGRKVYAAFVDSRSS
jgi:lysophospholipase L1-like esterase